MLSEVQFPGFRLTPEAMRVESYRVLIAGSAKIHDNEMTFLMELNGEGKLREEYFRPLTLTGRKKSWDSVQVIDDSFAVVSGSGLGVYSWNQFRYGIEETVVTTEDQCDGDLLNAFRIDGVLYLATVPRYGSEFTSTLCLTAVKD